MSRWSRLRAVLSAAIACASTACAAAGPPSGLVVRDVTVISPERPQPLEGAYVRILDGRIADVSPRRIRGVEEIEGEGRFLIPGLIDSHVHLGRVPGMTGADEAAHPDIAVAARIQLPRSYLFYGFTTVVDLASTPDFIAQWNALDLRPDAYFCGAAPLDEQQAERLLASVDPERRTVEAAVERVAAQGAACVSTDYRPDPAAPRVETARALVAAAHARRLPVLMSASSKEGQAFAVAAGVDVIAQGMWNGWRRTDRGRAPQDVDGILADAVGLGIGYQPTAQALFGEAGLFDDAFLSMPELLDAEPASLLAWYRTEEGQRVRNELAAQVGGRPSLTSYAEPFERLYRVIALLARSDARLLFGSDTPSDVTYANPAGLNGRLEMRHWISAGVTEQRLLRAMTIENARMLRLDDEIGTVEKGKIANLLLLADDPLDSVDAYDTIVTVFLHGRPITRETLSARNPPAPAAPQPEQPAAPPATEQPAPPEPAAADVVAAR